MYVYIKHDYESFYTVGFYTPDGAWCPESDQVTESAAAARVNYLNGGYRHAPPPPKQNETSPGSCWLEIQALKKERSELTELGVCPFCDHKRLAVFRGLVTSLDAARCNNCFRCFIKHPPMLMALQAKLSP